MMRVITGLARGRRLQTLSGDDVTRPTTESVKEALFSMIQFDIEGKRVLDLFAGSGQLGIEALSRGAVSCTFVENNRDAMKVVEANVNHCGFSDRSSIVLSDALSFLKRNTGYDIVLLDPPYGKGLIHAALPTIAQNISPDGLIICETARQEELPETVGDFVIDRVRNHGKSKITLYLRGKDAV